MQDLSLTAQEKQHTPRVMATYPDSVCGQRQPASPASTNDLRFGSDGMQPTRPTPCEPARARAILKVEAPLVPFRDTYLAHCFVLSYLWCTTTGVPALLLCVTAVAHTMATAVTTAMTAVAAMVDTLLFDGHLDRTRRVSADGGAPIVSPPVPRRILALCVDAGIPAVVQLQNPFVPAPSSLATARAPVVDQSVPRGLAASQAKTFELAVGQLFRDPHSLITLTFASE